MVAEAPWRSIISLPVKKGREIIYYLCQPMNRNSTTPATVSLMFFSLCSILLTAGGNTWAERPAPSSVGCPLPLKSMTVKQGILRYVLRNGTPGKEVALMGVNYYPHAWDQYLHAKALLPSLAARKGTVARDIHHIKLMGAQIIRVGLYEREISGADGGLVENEHLELADWVIDQCRKQGLYCYLTLMKYWWSPDSLPDTWVSRYAKEQLLYEPDALKLERRYVQAVLLHRNRFSGRSYARDNTIAVIEILNEPWYTSFEQLKEPEKVPRWQRGPHWRENIRALRKRFETWCAGQEPSRERFSCFRREITGTYIRTMVRTIRSVGARQPLVYNLFAVDMEGLRDIRDILPAVGASSIDAISLYHYIPGLNNAENDTVNTLPQCRPVSLPACLDSKARLVYEFDATGTRQLCAIYPAQARRFRQMGVQIACQFQYDAELTAAWNRDWYPHYLNRYYTPAKAASFSMACRVFGCMPREVLFSAPLPEDTQCWTPRHLLNIASGFLADVSPESCLFAVSFSHNQALLRAPNLWINAAPLSTWCPFHPAGRTETVISSGRNPWLDYDGNGLTVLHRKGRRLSIELLPDVEYIGPCYINQGRTPVARLVPKPHSCRFRLPGWKIRTLFHLPDHKTVPPDSSGAYLLSPGRYRASLVKASP